MLGNFSLKINEKDCLLFKDISTILKTELELSGDLKMTVEANGRYKNKRDRNRPLLHGLFLLSFHLHLF